LDDENGMLLGDLFNRMFIGLIYLIVSDSYQKMGKNCSYAYTPLCENEGL
jgi:hypothetical protein